MPDPHSLKVGDRIRFVSIPEEWNEPGREPTRESMRFMKHMLKRKSLSRVYEIDEYGQPWISARLRINGKVEHHRWAIMESTGWRKVRKRT